MAAPLRPFGSAMTWPRRHPLWAASIAVAVFWIVCRLVGWPVSILGFLAVVGWVGFLLWTKRAAIIGWVRARFAHKPAPYRFDGEQANHAAQAHETAVSIAHFEAEAADPDITPERRHWLNAHRAGMESRLAVLETTPRLTVEQMNERDAIETHLYGAPLARGRAAKPMATIKPLFGGGAVAGALGGWQLWAAGGAAFLASLGYGAWEHNRAERYEAEASEARAEAGRLSAALIDARAVNERLATDINRAGADAVRSARTIETERARVAQARRRERELLRDIQERTRDVGDPPDWGLRDGGPGDGGATP